PTRLYSLSLHAALPILLLWERLQPRAFALAPPPATAGGGWEGVPTVRGDARRHPSPALPCLRRGGSKGSRLPPLLRDFAVGPKRDRTSTRLNSSHVKIP